MHPVDVGHFAAHRRRFQLGPILAPGGDLRDDFHAGMRRFIRVGDGAHAGFLVGVPESEGDRRFLGVGDGNDHKEHQSSHQQSQELLHGFFLLLFALSALIILYLHSKKMSIGMRKILLFR